MNREAFLFRADPRIKLVMLILITASFFCPASPAAYGTLAAASALITLRTCGGKQLLNALRLIYPILILTAIMSPFFMGIPETVKIIFRFTGLTLIYFLYFSTTTADDFILTLRFFRVPYRFALIISIASRYIPFLLRAYNNAEAAHRLRKTDNTPEPGRWNLPARIKNMMPVLTAVLIQAVKSIPVLAMALETRGLGSSSRPTSLRKIVFRISPALQILLFFSSIIFIIIVILFL